MSTTRTRPLIGVTTYRQVSSWGAWERDAAVVPAGYVDRIAEAGGRPLLFPPCDPGAVGPEAGAAETMDILDGLVLIGGGDVDAAQYGQTRDPRNRGVSAMRDASEQALLAEALRADVPVLAICRGAQLLNVHLGGDLVQYLPEVIGATTHQPAPGAFGDVPVTTQAGSRIHCIVGDRLPVPCCHHQAIGELGQGLVVTARADDGVIEAIELPSHRFVVGVQWHPEERGGAPLFGALVEASRSGGSGMSENTLTVIDPATEKPIAELPLGGAEAVDVAVAQATRAFPAWRAVSPSDRARLMRRFATAVEESAEELAQLETANVGKPISDSRDEVAMVAEVLHFYAGAVDKHRGATVPVAAGVDLTFNEPMGVVAAIVPWNFPLAITSWKVGPALATGNTVVVKPSELTPLTALRLEALALEAGIPPGVLQVVVGTGPVAGARLAEHPEVAKVAFTGSTAVGREIMATASRTIKRVTLELGGKSANIVFADADVEQAAAAAPGGVFANSGQDCCARSRILVERSVFDRFLELLAEAVGAWRVGDPRHPDTQMGPLASAHRRTVVAGYLAVGMGDPHGGAVEPAITGSLPDEPGFWFPPTVVAPAENHWRLSFEEIFGPVVAVIPFDGEDEAVRLANDTPYGLSGSIWTRDGAKALRTARAVEAGNLSINSNGSVRVQTSFGGMKESGFGRELGLEALSAYSEIKNVFYATEP